MQDAAKFWDKISEKYAKTPISDEEAYMHTLSKTRGYLSASDDILEVGCGTGSTALLLAGNVHSITASDISRKMIEIGKKKAATAGVSNIRFVCEDILDIGSDTSRYDAVLAHNILHLVEHTEEALSAIRRCLKPGGMFISKTVCEVGANVSIKWRLMKLVLPLMQWMGKAPYVKFMTVTGLERLIEGHGFTIMESGNFPESALGRYIVARKD